jgi:SprT protein
MMIQPICETQQQQVCVATNHLLQKARELYNVDFSIIPVNFDLKGRAAGIYRTHGNQRSIRYNPYLFAKYFDDNLVTTVPHEVAHYVTDILFGLHHIKPHGTEWRSVMQDFGIEPQVTGRYDLTGIPIRQQKRFDYQCGCSIHKLSTIRHNKIVKGKARYYCRYCGITINPIT